MKMVSIILTMLFCLAGSVGKADMMYWLVSDTTRRVVQEYVQETDSQGNLIEDADGNPKMIWRDKNDEFGHPIYEDTGYAYVDDERLYSFIAPYAWSEDGYSGYDVGARVKVTFNNGTSTILPIKDNPVGYSILNEDESGIISTGNWASQSKLPSSELLEEALFSIELGDLTYDELLDMYAWNQVLAESDKYTYQDIIGNTYIEHDINPPR